MRPKLQEVAALTGVSEATVSRVMSGNAEYMQINLNIYTTLL